MKKGCPGADHEEDHGGDPPKDNAIQDPQTKDVQASGSNDLPHEQSMESQGASHGPMPPGRWPSPCDTEAHEPSQDAIDNSPSGFLHAWDFLSSEQKAWLLAHVDEASFIFHS